MRILSVKYPELSSILMAALRCRFGVIADGDCSEDAATKLCGMMPGICFATAESWIRGTTQPRDRNLRRLAEAVGVPAMQLASAVALPLCPPERVRVANLFPRQADIDLALRVERSYVFPGKILKAQGVFVSVEGEGWPKEILCCALGKNDDRVLRISDPETGILLVSDHSGKTLNVSLNVMPKRLRVSERAGRLIIDGKNIGAFERPHTPLVKNVRSIPPESVLPFHITSDSSAQNPAGSKRSSVRIDATDMGAEMRRFMSRSGRDAASVAPFFQVTPCVIEAWSRTESLVGQKAILSLLAMIEEGRAGCVPS